MQPCPPSYGYHCLSIRRNLSTLKIKIVHTKRIDFLRRGLSTDAQSMLMTRTSSGLRTLLPRVLQKERLPAWNQALERVTCQRNIERPKQIAVYGLDKLANPRSLVVALLDDPFASPADVTKKLRHENINSSDSPLIITNSPNVDNYLFRVQSNATRLSYLNAEILEIPFSHPDAIPLLWSADVRLLVATPLASPLTQDFLSIISHPSTLLIAQYTDNDPNVARYILSSLARSLPEDISSITVRAVNSAKALSAVDAFRHNPSTVYSVEIFQRDYLDSGISSIVQEAHSLLSVSKSIAEGDKSIRIAIGLLDACYESLHLLRKDINAALKEVHALQHSISTLRATASYELNVSDSITKSTRQMTGVFQQMFWWKLPLMVDDLSHTLLNVIQCSWCSDLVSRTDHQAGRLSLLREQATSQTIACYSQLPKSFQSAVSKNGLEQVSSELSGIGPSSLSYPITHRIQQLAESVTKLHRQVQNALLSSSCAILGSFIATYVAWYGQYLTPHGALGLCALGTVVVLRLFVGRWNTIKKRWWTDWNRVGQGLERDMEDILQKTIEGKALRVPLKSVEMLQDAIQSRNNDLNAIQHELDKIKIDLKAHRHIS